MTRAVLLVGGTGLFGGHLARQLARRTDMSLIVAGRRLPTLTALAQELGAEAVAFDRTDATGVQAVLTRLRPFAVIDCSGPFQNYGAAPYGFAKQVLRAGAHYLDIADGAAFVAGIGALDALAKEQGVCAWSGASTTPALSSAIAADLCAGLDEVDLIETSILPGNKTPRGLSVMRAILGQIGRPFAQMRGGRLGAAMGWSDSQRIAPKVGATALKPRLAALVNTPDAALFPRHFNAATVTARAGLELGLFHRSLGVLRYLVAALRISSLDPLSKPLLTLSNLFTGFGSDAGGMRVRVLGTRGAQRQERVWDMIIPDGHGPKTPVQPVVILLDQLLAGQAKPGARPALAAFTRAEAEAQLATIHATFERRDRDLIPIFEQALGPAFNDLPNAVQQLHRPAYVSRFKGTAEVRTATTLLGKLAALAGRFPLKGGQVVAEVEIAADGQSEVWIRNMGGTRFCSTLRYTRGQGVTEQFGPLTFDLDLHVSDGALHFPVTKGRAFGTFPIPHIITPVSETTETVDAEGRFVFDVRLSLPNGGLIVHYKGMLEPQ